MTLRRACIAAGVLAAIAGIALLRHHLLWPLGVQLGFSGVVLTAGLLIERAIYKPLAEAPGPGFSDTGERTRQNGAMVGVFYNPATGQRRYVALPPAPAQ